ncbi:hypothetical protein HanIR_Chr14g0690981 [Helianthus annuus]|nr:hypothetical protein HanIR_Chr14g0690981 [Helianthus annuus]
MFLQKTISVAAPPSPYGNHRLGTPSSRRKLAGNWRNTYQLFTQRHLRKPLLCFNQLMARYGAYKFSLSHTHFNRSIYNFYISYLNFQYMFLIIKS